MAGGIVRATGAPLLLKTAVMTAGKKDFRRYRVNPVRPGYVIFGRFVRNKKARRSGNVHLVIHPKAIVGEGVMSSWRCGDCDITGPRPESIVGNGRCVRHPCGNFVRVATGTPQIYKSSSLSCINSVENSGWSASTRSSSGDLDPPGAEFLHWVRCCWLSSRSFLRIARRR